MKQIILIVIVIALIASGFYYFRINKSHDEPVSIYLFPTDTLKYIPPPITNITESWKTYTDTGYGFSFQYPADWNYETSNTTIKIKDKQYQAIVLQAGTPQPNNMFRLIYAKNPDFGAFSNDELVEGLILPSMIKENIIKNRDIFLENGLKVREVDYGCLGYCVDDLFKFGDIIFQAKTSINSDSDLQMTHQILSTIKFNN